MIPRVEEILVRELEARIAANVPGVAASDDDTPETFVTTIETRKFNRMTQEQSGLLIYGTVDAEIVVVFYSQNPNRKRLDYSALIASFCSNPYIRINKDISVKIEMERSEAVEGKHLTNDSWLFKATYPIFDIEEVTPIIGAYISQAPEIGEKYKALYEDLNEFMKRHGIESLEDFCDVIRAGGN